MTAPRYRVARRMENAGRWRFRERFTGVDLGRVAIEPNRESATGSVQVGRP